VTLHESLGFHAKDPSRFGQTLTYDFDELTPQFQPFIDQANRQIMDKTYHFRTFVYPVETCPTYVTYKRLHVPATSIETCRQMALPKRIKYQLLMVRILLRGYGLGFVEGGASDAANIVPVTDDQATANVPLSASTSQKDSTAPGREPGNQSETKGTRNQAVPPPLASPQPVKPRQGGNSSGLMNILAIAGVSFVAGGAVHALVARSSSRRKRR